MWKKEMARLLEERAERILSLEQRLEKSGTIIETYRAREQTIVDSLASSQAEARQRIADAEAKADALIGNARLTAENATRAAETSASEIVSRAEAYRDELINNAKAQAEEMLKSAREKSSAMLGNAQAAVAEYREALERYNALIEDSAAHAQERAQQYAEFLKTQTLPTPEMTKTAESLAAAPYAAPVELPDVTDNPAQLMRNIYTLEKREIPEEAGDRPAYPTPSVETEDAEEAPTAVEPASAWTKEPSETEEPAVQTPAETEQTPMAAEEPEELPDLAPRPEQAPPEEPSAEETPVQEEEASVAYAEPEELPDLAPRPEPMEWRPEDEAAEPEWQPEAEEPAMPTVSELTSERPVDDDVEMSLDALLDEIIHAGE